MFFKNVFKVSFITLLSRVLGLIRDTTTAIFLGASAYSDAFVIAFKLPNVFRKLFAEGSLNSVFIPIFADVLQNQGEKQAKQFSNEIFTLFFIILLILIGIMELFMPYILLVIAPGFNMYHKEGYELAITLTRITLPYLFFISLASIYASILNSFKKFSIVAALPFVLNITIIGVFWFSRIHNFGLDVTYFGAIGITLGGIIQFLLMWLCLYRIKWKVLFTSIFKLSNNAKLFFKRVLPIVLTSGIYQINIFIDLTIASWLESGAITYLYYGDRLNQLPLAIIGIALSTVMVPFIVGNKRSDIKEESFNIKSKAILYGILLGIPAVLAFLVLGKEIIIMLFNYGKFNVTSVKFTYYVLCFYALGLIPNILIKIIVAIFYAESDGKTPFYVNISMLLVNTILAICLAKYMGVCGVALATAITSFITVIILIVVLYKKNFVKINNYFFKELCKGLILSTLIFLCVYLFKDWLFTEIYHNFGRKGFVISMLIVITTIIMIWFLGLKLIKSKLYYEITNLIKKNKEA